LKPLITFAHKSNITNLKTKILSNYQKQKQKLTLSDIPNENQESIGAEKREETFKIQ
jgi:hypothetical protein